MEKTETEDRERSPGEGERRADSGRLRRPPEPRAASGPAGTAWGGRAPTDRCKLGGAAGRQRRRLWGGTARSRPARRSLGPGNRGKPVCHGWVRGNRPVPAGGGGACEDWGGGGRPPPRLKGRRRGARRKGPRPGGPAKAHTPSRRGQTAGGRAAEAPTHHPHPPTQPPIRPVPLPARRGKSHSPAPPRRGPAPLGAAAGPEQPGAGRAAAARDRSRHTALARHRPTTAAAPPCLASRHNTAPSPPTPASHPITRQPTAHHPIASSLLSLPGAPSSVSQWEGAPPQRPGRLPLWPRGDVEVWPAAGGGTRGCLLPSHCAFQGQHVGSTCLPWCLHGSWCEQQLSLLDSFWRRMSLAGRSFSGQRPSSQPNLGATNTTFYFFVNSRPDTLRQCCLHPQHAHHVRLYPWWLTCWNR